MRIVGLPDKLRRLAQSINHYRKVLFIAIGISFIIGILSIQNINKAGSLGFLMISVLSVSVSVIVFSWSLWLALVWINFYPNKAYDQSNTALNYYELSTDTGKTICLIFTGISLLIVLLLSAASLLFLMAPLYLIITNN